MRTQVGNCPQCGAPIWMMINRGPSDGLAGTKIPDYDNPIFTCECRKIPNPWYGNIKEVK